MESTKLNLLLVRITIHTVWKPSALARSAGWVLTALGGICAAAGVWAIFTAHLGGGVAALVVGTGWGTVAFRSAVWPELRAENEGLVVRNPFRTHVIRWETIRRLAPSSRGIAIYTKDRKPVFAWAVQRSNFSSVVGRTSRADRIIMELATLIEKQRGGAQPDLTLGTEARHLRDRSVRRDVTVLSVLLVTVGLLIVLSRH